MIASSFCAMSLNKSASRVPAQCAPVAIDCSRPTSVSGCGIRVHQKQIVLGWGKSVVLNLARDLQAEFPGHHGFSAQNLWLMLQFFREYNDKPKLQPLVRVISWAKNMVILSRCKDDLEHEFYLRATARFGWTKAVVQHQIDNKSYENINHCSILADVHVT